MAFLACNDSAPSNRTISTSGTIRPAQNTVGRNIVGVSLSVQAIATMKKPSLSDLLSLHATARGEMVASPDEAETVFSAESGTPFELDRIAADFLA